MEAENLEKVFRNPEERKSYFRDSYFMEIYEFNNPCKHNPYLLLLKSLEENDEKAREILVEKCLTDKSFEEKIKYIGKLRRGLEILRKLGKV